MGFRFFHWQRIHGRRIFGLILMIGGLAVVVDATPLWVWYAILGIGLMGAGWFLLQHK